MPNEQHEPPAAHEEQQGSVLSAERGRLKDCARKASQLAQKRGRLKNVVGRIGAFARRLGRRPG